MSWNIEKPFICLWRQITQDYNNKMQYFDNGTTHVFLVLNSPEEKKWLLWHCTYSGKKGNCSVLERQLFGKMIAAIHYNDVIMTTITSQITSLAVVYSTVYSDADQRKHQSSASLAFVWGIHRERWIPRTKGQLRGKCFHLMTSSCYKLVPNGSLN